MPYLKKEDKKEYNRNYQINHKLRIKVAHKEKSLLKLYNLTKEQWFGMWYAQDGRCAICGNFFEDEEKICVDHNHDTGKIRGLLCHKCNVGLGHFNDNATLLKSATEYLDAYNNITL